MTTSTRFATERSGAVLTPGLRFRLPSKRTSVNWTHCGAYSAIGRGTAAADVPGKCDRSPWHGCRLGLHGRLVEAGSHKEQFRMLAGACRDSLFASFKVISKLQLVDGIYITLDEAKRMQAVRCITLS